MTSSSFVAGAPIERLSRQEAQAGLQDLAEALRSCVADGAGVGFLMPFTREEAEAFWRSKLAGIEAGTHHLLAARVSGRLVGAVMLVPAQAPNSVHRADVSKLLVHPAYRRRGLAQRLLTELDKLALFLGKTLLVLDTATGDVAEGVYPKFGYQRLGVIPGFARFPDGRLGATTVFYKEVREADEG